VRLRVILVTLLELQLHVYLFFSLLPSSKRDFTMVHNRDVLVNCMKRYYDLLVCAPYLDPSAIETPPPSGWTDEQLTVDILRVLGRSEGVKDLLRRVPYIKSKPRYEVWEVTIAINYLRSVDWFKGAMAEECKGKTVNDFCLMPDDANWPAGFILLTEGQEAYLWIVDTDKVRQQTTDVRIVARANRFCRCYFPRRV
jgi:hypothetical protein